MYTQYAQHHEIDDILMHTEYRYESSKTISCHEDTGTQHLIRHIEVTGTQHFIEVRYLVRVSTVLIIEVTGTQHLIRHKRESDGDMEISVCVTGTQHTIRHKREFRRWRYLVCVIYRYTASHTSQESSDD